MGHLTFVKWISYEAMKKIAVFQGEFKDIEDNGDFMNIFMVIFCTICAALASGLTIGMMAFDSTKLALKSMTGTAEEANAAASILPIIKKHHLVLVTLLVFNAVATESLPVFLEELVPSYVAILLSVTLVLLFGEIIPASIFTGPKQLLVTAYCTKLVKFLMMLFWPISYPISKILDYLFGLEDESVNVPRVELEAMIRLMPVVTKQSSSTATDADGLGNKEVSMLIGVLRLTKFSAKDIMIPIDTVYSISADMVLDEQCLHDILMRGFSRVLVYHRKDKHHIIGFLLVKALALINPKLRIPIRSIKLYTPLVVPPDLGLPQLLHIFQTTKAHMAVVSDRPEEAIQCLTKKNRPSQDGRYLGIVTMEDVLETLLQDKIFDETDPILEHPVGSENENIRTHEHGHVHASVVGKFSIYKKLEESASSTSTPSLQRKSHMIGATTGAVRVNNIKKDYDVVPTIPLLPFNMKIGKANDNGRSDRIVLGNAKSNYSLSEASSLLQKGTHGSHKSAPALHRLLKHLTRTSRTSDGANRSSSKHKHTSLLRHSKSHGADDRGYEGYNAVNQV